MAVHVSKSLPPAIAVRDSKDPDGPHLDLTSRSWQAFVTSLKAPTR